MVKQVLITGGRGLVGRHLCKALLQRGYAVSVLTRSLSFGCAQDTPFGCAQDRPFGCAQDRPFGCVDQQRLNNITDYAPDNHLTLWGWTPQQIPEEAVLQADAIIHLAGANIFAKRWTSARKKRIIESRVLPSKGIAAILRKHGKKLHAYISASAVGYYGTLTCEKIFCESDPPGHDFTGQTAVQWEKAADEVARLGIRTVKLRTGIVLAKDGGALAKMLPAFRLGLGSPLGSGKQYFPWVHIDDLVNMYLHALEEEHLHGAYNAALQSNTTSLSFGKSLAQCLNRPYFMPAIPAKLLQIALGKERAQLLLEGSRISDEKIRKSGYSFMYENLTNALKNLLKP